MLRRTALMKEGFDKHPANSIGTVACFSEGARSREPTPLKAMEANSETTEYAPLRDYVAALLQVTGQLMLVIDHMARAAATAPSDADDVPTVLTNLIEGILAPTIALEDACVAAAVINRTGELIGEELYMVPLAGDD